MLIYVNEIYFLWPFIYLHEESRAQESLITLKSSARMPPRNS